MITTNNTPRVDRRRADRRVPPAMDEGVIEVLAERAAERAMEKLEDRLVNKLTNRVADHVVDRVVDKVAEQIEGRFLQKVGKTFIEKFLYLVGSIVIAFAYWLNSKGLLHFG